MSNPALLLDYLFLVGRVIDRLKDQMPELEVMPIEAYTQAKELATRSNTAFVFWEGETFPAQVGPHSLVTQQFTVILAVRNAAQTQRDARNDSAGPLLSRAHKALTGWAPEGCARPFRRSNGSRRPSYGANHGLYPLTFDIQLSL